MDPYNWCLQTLWLLNRITMLVIPFCVVVIAGLRVKTDCSILFVLHSQKWHPGNTLLLYLCLHTWAVALNLVLLDPALSSVKMTCHYNTYQFWILSLLTPALHCDCISSSLLLWCSSISNKITSEIYLDYWLLKHPFERALCTSAIYHCLRNCMSIAWSWLIICSTENWHATKKDSTKMIQ